MSNITHYDILEVSKDASKEEIKAAYKEGIKITHPDRHGGKGGHLFILIEEAWRVLGNDELKAQYDASLDQPSNNPNSPESPPEPQWGEESLWDEDIQESETTSTYPPASYSSASIPQPEHDVHETSWINKPQLSLPETFAPKNPSLLLNIGLILITVASWAGAYVLLGPWALVFIVPSLLLAAYIRAQHVLGWQINLPAFGVVGGVIAGWQLLETVTRNSSSAEYLQYFFFVISFLVLPMFTAYKWRKYLEHKRLIKESFTMEQAKWKVLGKPGNGITDAVDDTGRATPAIGQVAEQMTGDVLESLLKIPGVRIFHGLRFPGNATNDVDHAVIYGNKVALVESKLWNSGEYAWNNRGEIVRDGGYRDINATTQFPLAVKKYANALPDARVGGFLLIHSKTPDGVFTDNTYFEAASGIGIVTPQMAIETIGKWFLEDESKENIVNRRLLWEVWQYKLP